MKISFELWRKISQRSERVGVSDFSRICALKDTFEKSENLTWLLFWSFFASIVLGAEKALSELSGCAQRFLFAILVFFEKSNVEIFYFGLLV